MIENMKFVSFDSSTLIKNDLSRMPKELFKIVFGKLARYTRTANELK